jgi:hypothetical protein
MYLALSLSAALRQRGPACQALVGSNYEPTMNKGFPQIIRTLTI